MTKCVKCGYDDNGTGDWAHVCGPVAVKTMTLNEKARLLAEQAGAETWSRSPMRAVTGLAFTDENLEKFVKIIAAECMKIAVFKDDGMIATADVAGYMAAGRSTAAKLIKEHFEVNS